MTYTWIPREKVIYIPELKTFVKHIRLNNKESSPCSTCFFNDPMFYCTEDILHNKEVRCTRDTTWKEVPNIIMMLSILHLEDI